jgi:hypothetical protein
VLGPDLIQLELTRVVGPPAALDAVLSQSDLRISADEALSFAEAEDLRAEFPARAIVETDTGWSGAWFAESALATRLASLCEWELPERPGVGQGFIAGIPAKVFLPPDSDEALLMVATAHAHEMEERLA